MLTIRRVIKHELSELFSYLKCDFPMRERIPAFLIRQAVISNILHPFFLINNETIVGYAICQPAVFRSYVLVHYFAILPDLRSKGMGGVFLQMLADEYATDTLVLEAEDPEAAKTAQAYRMRKKRLSFYERCGFSVQQGWRFNQVGVRMLCLAKSQKPIDNIVALWTECYEAVLGPLLAKIVCIYRWDFDYAGVKAGCYRHFKGGLYKVTAVARHSETEEWLVVYESLQNGGTWVRPASMWNERTANGQRRFQFIGR